MKLPTFFLSLALAGLAGAAIPASAGEAYASGGEPGCLPGWTVICHTRPRHPLVQRTLFLPPWALQWHLSHGDTLGACDRNVPPVANAGPDQTAPVAATVALDGSASTDDDGDPLTFLWSFQSRPAGSAAALSDPAAVNPTFVIDEPGTYVLELVVDDGQASSAPDTVEVSTVNSPPVADAGPDQTVLVAQTAVLDAGGSTDVDGDTLTFSWEFLSRPAGSLAALTDPASVNPSFIADLPGDYVVQLVVSDGLAASAADTVTVSTENSAPVADAGPDQSVFVGAAAQLDGSGSTDVDGDALAFRWDFLARPAGSLAVLSDPAAVNPTFDVDLPGTFVVQLVVSDGALDSAADTVLITTDNRPPFADAGDDQTVPLGGTAGLDGSGSTDPDGDPLTFGWSLLSAPPGSAAVLSDPGVVNPTFVADQPGTYVAQLVVHDGTASSAPDTVTVSTENSAPVADAGADQEAIAGDTVPLDGGASADPDGTPLQFSWSLTSRPIGSTAAISDPALVDPTFVADVPGAYVAQLIVSDGLLSSAPDTALITVAAPVVTLAASDADAAEAAADPGQFTFSRTGGAAVPLLIRYTVDGTATNGTDYDSLSGTVTIPGGASAVTLDVTPLDDGAFELAETVVLTLDPDPGYEIGTAMPAVVTIADDDTLVGVAAGDREAGEAGPDPGTFTVSRLGPIGGALTVFYTVGGTATGGMDYAALGGTVTIAAGATAAEITVSPIDDALFEGPETVVLTLTADPGYTVSGTGAATVTIADDERPVVTIVATDGNAAEAGLDPGTFTVTRTGPTTGALTVHYAVTGGATSGVDYVAIPASLTIPALETSASVTLTPIDDALIEGAESATLVLVADAAYTVGTPSIAAVTIADDDVAVVTITATDPDASEAGPTTGTFTFTRTGGTAESLVVFFTRSGTADGGAGTPDYAGIGTLVSIPAGQSSADVTLTPLADNLVEGPETATLTISPSGNIVVGTPSSATVTIADDAPVVTVTATDPEAAEAGADPGVFTFQRTGGNLASPLAISSSFGGTASNAGDFVFISGIVTVPAGETAATLTITPLADNRVEGDETMQVTIVPSGGVASYVIGTPGTATVTIADDPPVVSLTATDATASEAGLDPGEFTVTRTGGNPGAVLSVLVSRSGTAANGGDYASLGGGTFLVSIPAGETSAVVAVTPIDDALVEGDETVVLTLQPSVSYAIAPPGTATVTITDDD